MVPSLHSELKQRAAFSSLEQEAYLSIWRTADLLQRGLVELLRPADLTPTQYNVLRILRGAGPEGLPSGEVGERMVTRDPDITRLLDRMEKRGWVARVREEDDRRVVRATITAAGKRLTDSLDAPVAELHLRQLRHLGKARLEELISALAMAREANG